MASQGNLGNGNPCILSHILSHIVSNRCSCQGTYSCPAKNPYILPDILSHPCPSQGTYSCSSEGADILSFILPHILSIFFSAENIYGCAPERANRLPA